MQYLFTEWIFFCVHSVKLALALVSRIGSSARMIGGDECPLPHARKFAAFFQIFEIRVRFVRGAMIQHRLATPEGVVADQAPYFFLKVHTRQMRNEIRFGLRFVEARVATILRIYSNVIDAKCAFPFVSFPNLLHEWLQQRSINRRFGAS